MPALKKYHDREDGFTLIELLIVVLIIGILAAIAIPVYIGIQNQGYKSAVKADVNISVKRVQVALTEGKTTAEVKSNQAAYTQKSVKGEVVEVRTSTTAGASDNDFSLSGIVTTSSAPAGPVNYGYFYDSVTGKFTESDDAIALGASTPSLIITTGSLPNATVGTAYSATVATTAVKPNGATQYAATGLPTGWAMNANTGVISAPASAVTTATTLSITVTATNGAVTVNKTYTVNVYDKPTITTTNLPAALKGTNYSQTIAATANPAATFAVTGGNLPTGITLSAAGLLAGTSTDSGPFNFTVTATNAGGTDAKAYTLTVNDSPAVTTLALADATVGTAYNTTLTATGYPTPTFAVTNLPSGLSFDGVTNKISGTPDSSAGATAPSVKIVATNPVSSDTKNLTLTVNAIAPTVTLSTLPNGKIGTAYSAMLTAANNSGSVTWTKSSGTIPSGLSLNTSTGVISGTPTGSNADYTFGVTATAAGKTSAEKTYTIKIALELTYAQLVNGDVEYGYNLNNYWHKTADPGYNGLNTIDTVNFPRHSGNWAFHTKTVNNQGSFQGVGYCAPYSVPAGTRVNFGVWASTQNSPTNSNSAFGTGTQLRAYAYAGNAGGGDVYTDSYSKDDYKYLSGTYTTTQAGNICVDVGANIYGANDYFRDIFADDITITLGG